MSDLFDRLGGYSPLEVAIELALIAAVVWVVVRFVQGTRAAGALKGILLVLVGATLIVQIAGRGDAFPRLTYIYDRLLAVIAIGLLVIFQPELRRAMIRLGEAPLFGGGQSAVSAVVDAVVDSSVYLAKARFGAIVVIERRVGLSGLVEGGTQIDAELTSGLLKTIFYPGTALHDLAVLVRGTRLHAAGVQLPMGDERDLPDPTMGARHRAAIGLTRECDAIVVVVSEESGNIRLAERGRLGEPLEADDLRAALSDLLGSDATDAAPEPEAFGEADKVEDEPAEEAGKPREGGA
ncbi:MAG: diadenylate cyclase [Planctomycetota bacterium]